MTRLFGIIGSPISHSLSPAMHEAVLRALHLDALYAPFEVPPRFLASMLRGLILAGVDGLNVTVPLKEAVIPLLDRVDPTARAIGAVNTILIRHRRTIGYNTDGVGFMRALAELGWRRGPTRAVILGAGGAARAVAWELSRIPGSSVTIANRHVLRAKQLARWLLRAHPRAEIRATTLSRVSLTDATVLINATTVGMRRSDPLLVSVEALRRGMFVYDLVYHRETRLVRAARRRGCVAANGLSMLLYQGAESLRVWLRRSPPVDVMRRALIKAVAQQTS